MTSERDYWRGMNGHDYEAMFAGKYKAEFAAQEAWLLERARISSLHRVLVEFGCGAGRLARALWEECEYVGWDTSVEMTRPLAAAINAEEIKAQLVHPLIDPVGTVAFCVSVLIHTPPEALPEMLAKMTASALSGEVWLIENKRHIGESVRESDEHGGCWKHDYARYVPPGWSIEEVVDLCATHDAYVLVAT